MNNFELHEKAQQLADTTSAYELARQLIQIEESRDHLSGCFHSACEELAALKAALVDEGDETPVGPALSLLENLKAERDGLRQKLLTGRDMYEGGVERCQDAEIQTSQVGMRLRQYQEERDALAAHVSDVLSALNSTMDEFECCTRVAKVIEAGPDASLARRDARVVADALGNLLPVAKVSGTPHLIDTIETNIHHLRRQASSDAASPPPASIRSEADPDHQAAADKGFKGAPPGSDAFIRRLRAEHEVRCQPAKPLGGSHD